MIRVESISKRMFLHFLVGRSKLKRIGDGETGATGGYSLADEENSNKRPGPGGGMVRYGATPVMGTGASSSGIPSASAGKRSTSLPRHKQAAPTRLAASKGSGMDLALLGREGCLEIITRVVTVDRGYSVDLV